MGSEPPGSVTDDAEVPMPAAARVHMLADDLALVEIPAPEACFPPPLTEAERDIAQRVFDGATNDEIARARGVSVKTVGNQLAALYRKLGVDSRVELVLLLRSAGDEVAE